MLTAPSHATLQTTTLSRTRTHLSHLHKKTKVKTRSARAGRRVVVGGRRLVHWRRAGEGRVGAAEHRRQIRVVAEDEHLLIEVGDVQRARQRERTGQEAALAERLDLDKVLAEGDGLVLKWLLSQGVGKDESDVQARHARLAATASWRPWCSVGCLLIWNAKAKSNTGVASVLA